MLFSSSDAEPTDSINTNEAASSEEKMNHHHHQVKKRSSNKKQKVTFKNVPAALSETEVRAAFEDYAYSKCCYGKKPAHSMTIISLETEHAYRYVLQTYTESSKTTPVTEAYIDNSLYGYGRFVFVDDAFIVKPRKLFQYEVVTAEVPNTSKIKNCDSCSGMGDEVCLSCRGHGKAICYACIGTGRIEEKLINQEESHYAQHSCMYCYGKGFTSCYDCRSSGSIQCYSCKGSGKIKSYMQLNVTFETVQNECLKKPERIPEQLIRSCHEQLMFSEQAENLNSIKNHVDPDINEASSRLLDFHYRKTLSTRIIAQRHEIYIIPITRCKYSYNKKISDFYICGLDHKVYAPNYPEKCVLCCCSSSCTVL